MALLSDSNWTELFGWIEGHSQWGRFPIDKSKPLRSGQELRVWLHQVAPAMGNTKAASAGAARPISDGPAKDNDPGSQVVVERQFPRLGQTEMAKLEDTRNTSL